MGHRQPLCPCPIPLEFTEVAPVLVEVFLSVVVALLGFVLGLVVELRGVSQLHWEHLQVHHGKCVNRHPEAWVHHRRLAR